MRYAPWVLVVVLLVGALFVSSQDRSGEIAELQRRTDVMDRLAAEANARYTALGDTVLVLRDSLQIERHRLQRERVVVRTRADTVEVQLRESLDSASAVLLDTLIAAHDEERSLWEEEVAGYQQESAILWRRIEYADSALLASAALVEAVRAENRALSRRRWPVKAVAVGVVVGVLLAR